MAVTQAHRNRCQQWVSVTYLNKTTMNEYISRKPCNRIIRREDIVCWKHLKIPPVQEVITQTEPPDTRTWSDEDFEDYINSI